MIAESEMRAKVVSLQVGKPVSVEHGKKEVLTAIFKQSSNAIHKLSYTGLEGDEQGDKVYHGGKDKAVCVYLQQWYPYWAEQLQRSLEYGAFGENITVSDWSESQLCIGDQLQLGSAVVEISQPRQPCYKLGLRNDFPALPAKSIEAGYTGFYLRVLVEGEVAAGDELVMLKQHHARKSVAEANRIMYKDKQDQAGLEELLAVEELADSWKQQLRKRLAGMQRNNEELKQ